MAKRATKKEVPKTAARTGRSLVVVESPAKAKTINKYLGRGYVVKASLGHVKDLPKGKLGVDIEKNFRTTYQIIPGKTKVITELRRAAEHAPAIYLAADPDREGEAICAHLAEVLSDGRTRSGRAVHRVLFNEITQRAILAAFEKPGKINNNLVEAQQARRVLDRLVGYQISPLLWDKVRRGLSAGRVQTVALRLVVERERAIRAFVPKEYWTIHALLEAGKPPIFEAKLIKFRGEDLEIPNGEEAGRIVAALEEAVFAVTSVTRREKRRYAPPPFTTSKLQQEAWNKLRFTAKRTMALAQRLYEGREMGEEGSVGLITYMRTDSTRVSEEALASVREFIASQFGSGFVPEKPNVFKSKKALQDAHEAIRPSGVERAPESVKAFLERDEYLLYRLIWQRFVASQMVPALYDQTSVDVTAGEYLFRATGSVLKFPGFLAVYQEGHDEKEIDEDEEEMKHRLPVVSEGERLRVEQLKPEQHFTEPPPRYSEGTLVKELEEKGIGRPSTYAMILSTIQEREYVRKDEGRFAPTQLGEIVNDLLVKSFEDIFDVGYTARMEAELDEIEEGKVRWREVIGEFYERFEKDLERAGDEMANYKAGIPTDHKCEKCGKPMLERLGRHGFFLACSGYPECTHTRDLGSDLAEEELESEVGEEYCENCGRPMTIKRGRFGAFLACTGYPECKTTRRLQRGKGARRESVFLDEKCPSDGGQLVMKYGRYGEFIACANYPKCKFTKPKSLGIACPKCGQGQLCEKRARKGRRRIFYGCDRYPDCDYTVGDRPIPESCPDCKAPFLLERKVKGEIAHFCAKKECTYRILIAPPPATEAAVPTPAKL